MNDYLELSIDAHRHGLIIHAIATVTDSQTGRRLMPALHATGLTRRGIVDRLTPVALGTLWAQRRHHGEYVPHAEQVDRYIAQAAAYWSEHDWNEQ
ncbi:hypothetical protein [Bifidobacterium biavatii]|uniref:Uncharacterized protein n=1 Tax=Bifidobacterium biavatii DSM 23969 TaxID=1437608 RepID=A0A086ZTT7_9BIFI|nr:hypothetical protein [Bifidobacterium biavatii]KFI49937.1 hypothetical protein BBIA_1859 [Bifidobacterium biavatii DSM 23969]